MLTKLTVHVLLLLLPATIPGDAAVVDGPTGATIAIPDGYRVTPNQGIPEWHVTSTTRNTSAPPLGENASVLCAIQFSATPAVGGRTDPAYLRDEVDGHMRSLGARDPASVFEPSALRFLMTSEWNPSEGDDADNTVFMYHAESNKVYVYMDCVTRRSAAGVARTVFRRFWNGIKLPN